MPSAQPPASSLVSGHQASTICMFHPILKQASACWFSSLRETPVVIGGTFVTLTDGDASGLLVVVFSGDAIGGTAGDRKSTRLNSSHRCISYAVFCLKKKKTSQ